MQSYSFDIKDDDVLERNCKTQRDHHLEFLSTFSSNHEWKNAFLAGIFIHAPSSYFHLFAGGRTFIIYLRVRYFIIYPRACLEMLVVKSATQVKHPLYVPLI